jgi:hypothetical protein
MKWILKDLLMLSMKNVFPILSSLKAKQEISGCVL